MPAETTAKREAGVDLARAFALLLLVMPVSVALNLVPENRLHWLGSVPPAANTLLAALLGISAYLYARRVTFPQFLPAPWCAPSHSSCSGGCSPKDAPTSRWQPTPNFRSYTTCSSRSPC